MNAVPEKNPTGRSEITREQRRRLDAKIEDVLAADAETAGSGWRLESRTESEAVLTRERKVNHRLHLILTLVTLGMWVFVWMVVAAHSTEPQRKILKV